MTGSRATPSDRTRAANARALRVLAWRRDGETLQQIGDRLGLTRERVRQIEARGIKHQRLLDVLAR